CASDTRPPRPPRSPSRCSEELRFPPPEGGEAGARSAPRRRRCTAAAVCGRDHLSSLGLAPMDEEIVNTLGELERKLHELKKVLSTMDREQEPPREPEPVREPEAQHEPPQSVEASQRVEGPQGLQPT